MKVRSNRPFRRTFAVVSIAALVLAFLAALVTTTPRPRAITLTVVSLNVHRCAAGIDRVVAALNGRAAEIVCLQETTEADARAIAGLLAMPHVHFATRVARPIDGGEPWGCAILSRRPLADVGPIPRFAGKGVMGLWARVDLPGGLVRIANVHLAATYGLDLRHVVESNGWRAIELADLAEAHRVDGLPLLAIGDFNQPPTGENYDAMRRLGTDVLADLGDVRPTFRSGWIATRIDYAIATPSLHATAGGLGDDGASDHRPVWIDLRIGRR